MRICLAVDIGSYYIKIVEGSIKKEKFYIRTAGITRNPFPNAHISLNENIQKKFVGFLKDFLKKIGVKRRETICSISGEEVIIHYFDIPDVPENEIKNIVDLELLQVVPGGLEKFEFDYTILPAHTAGKKTVMLAGMTKAKCDFFVDTLVMAGLKPIIMDVGSIALANCFLSLNKQNQGNPTLLINAGAANTSIAIPERNGFIFVREIDFGGNRINQELSKMKKISMAEAEQIKKNPVFKNEVENILQSLTEEALQEILTSLKYFEARTQKKVERFLLTGGSSLLPGFVKIIEKFLGIPGEIWTPISGLYENCRTDEPECVQVCFSTVLGLAARKLI